MFGVEKTDLGREKAKKVKKVKKWGHWGRRHWDIGGLGQRWSRFMHSLNGRNPNEI